MQKHIPQFDLPGTQDVFNLAGESDRDWDRLKREQQEKIRDQRIREQRQIKLYDLPGIEPGSHWT